MPNINDQLNQSSKEYGVGSATNYFKFQRGDNRLRILTAGEVLATHFFGKGVKASTCYGIEKGCPFHGDKAPKDPEGKEKKPSIKYVCYVIDVNDKTQSIQLADLPFSIIKQVGDYQQNIDYAFDSFPMPYDITIKFDPDSASPAGMYKVIASPKREPVSDEVMSKLAEEMSMLTPAESVSKKKTFQLNDHKKQGIWLSPKQIAENKKNWRVNVNAENKRKIESGEIKVETPIDYPQEDIRAGDIPW